jgi:hypothetical protein
VTTASGRVPALPRRTAVAADRAVTSSGWGNGWTRRSAARPRAPIAEAPPARHPGALPVPVAVLSP